MRLSFLSLLFLSLFSVTALAVQPDEKLADPKLEERARIISQDLRCLVCQNQSIDDSDADLARDLRVIVRERLVAGDSNEEVLSFITDRYGNYVLLDPPVNAQTMVLWGGPVVIFLIGAIAVFFWFRGREKEAVASTASGEGVKPKALSAEEEKRLKELLGDSSQEGEPS